MNRHFLWQKKRNKTMAIFTVTWGGYYPIEAESWEEAREKFILYVEEEEIDSYGRDWKDLIKVKEEEEE